MHPAEVLLQPEPQTVEMRRPRHPGPRSRLLGDHRDARVAFVAGGVQLTQELDRFEILLAAVHVGRPGALWPGVVAVQHRGDRIHPKTVDMELLQPEEGTCDQEVTYLAVAEVEHVRAPVGVFAQRGVGMLVQSRAVKACKRPLVPREMGGHPVENHADTGVVERVDEPAELVGCAEARGGCEVPGQLITPRPAERMLHHRHQLDVRETEVGHVRDEVLREPRVREPLPPGAEVHLVDAHRVGVGNRRRTAFQPLGVLPFVRGLVHDRRGRGWLLGALSERVRLEPSYAVCAVNGVLIPIAGAGVGSAVPHTVRSELEVVRARAPIVEVTHDLDPCRVGCPDREPSAVGVRTGPATTPQTARPSCRNHGA